MLINAEVTMGDHGGLPEARGGAAYEFFQKLRLPAFHADRNRGLYLANPALAQTFGYADCTAAEDAFRRGMFLAAHFSPETVAQFYERAAIGRIDGWLMRGKTLDGRELLLEIHAKVRLINPQGPPEYTEAFFTEPDDGRTVESFLEKARREAALAVKAKNEFLSNISHELRTPLNIVIGMLNMSMEDRGISPEARENLALAQNAAEGLLSLLNNLILLSNLEARRLTTEVAQFTPELLVQSLLRKFRARAAEKNITLVAEFDEFKDDIFDGGYNLISMALEKLLHNAIKFGREGGRAVVKATVTHCEDGLWLHCEVSDDGPGLDKDFLGGQDELFRQGDGSINRKHGGLGLGLRLAGSLTRHLGGEMLLRNGEGGGASPKFSVPVRFSKVELSGN